MQQKRRGHCPTCGPEKLADVVAEFSAVFDDEPSGVWTSIVYRTLKCGGCEDVYFQTESQFSEDVEYVENPHTGEVEPEIPSKLHHYPEPLRREEPKWIRELWQIDKDLKRLLDDVYGAINADLRVPAAVALRTAFDRAVFVLRIDPNLTFAQKLNRALADGIITAKEKEALEVLVDAGGAAAHRGWCPNEGELRVLTDVLEAFLHRTFILHDAAIVVRGNIPPRPTSRT